MVKHNHNNEHGKDTRDPRGSLAALMAALLAELLIGSLAGAVAVLLLAPHSGKRARAKL